MGLLERLEEYKEDNKYIEDVLNRLKERDKVYIFGANFRAQWLGKRLNENNVNFCGFLVNQKFYHEDSKVKLYGYEKPIWCYEEVINKEDDITIILGVPYSILDMDMFKCEHVEEVVTINWGVQEDYIFSYGTLLEHKQELEEFYDMLEDDYSKECLFYNLRGRLTGRDYDFTQSAWTKPQYFLDDVLEWRDEECIVDCGAYDGDTVEEFLRKRPKTDNFTYKIYAWEPEKSLCEAMEKKFEDDTNIIVVPKATYSKAGTIGFSSEEKGMSTISLEEENLVETDTIDAVLGNDKASFIKMDIEGGELEALIGAKEQIKNNKPRLAICIYHKQEDFWTIPQYIKQLNPNYKFYIKTHSKMPTELVLFCV